MNPMDALVVLLAGLSIGLCSDTRQSAQRPSEAAMQRYNRRMAKIAASMKRADERRAGQEARIGRLRAIPLRWRLAPLLILWTVCVVVMIIGIHTH